MKKGIFLAIISLLIGTNAFADIYDDVKGIWRGNLTKVTDQCGGFQQVSKEKWLIRYSTKYGTNVEVDGITLVHPWAIVNKSLLATQYYIYADGTRIDLGAKMTNITKNKANVESQVFITRKGKRCAVIHRGTMTK